MPEPVCSVILSSVLDGAMTGFSKHLVSIYYIQAFVHQAETLRAGLGVAQWWAAYLAYPRPQIRAPTTTETKFKKHVSCVVGETSL